MRSDRELDEKYGAELMRDFHEMINGPLSDLTAMVAVLTMRAGGAPPQDELLRVCGPLHTALYDAILDWHINQEGTDGHRRRSEN